MAISLFDNGSHRCLMFADLVDDTDNEAVQANQFLIVSGKEGALIDPAGNMTYNALIMAMARYFPARELKYILASHADPDIVASLNKWLVSTQCQLLVSKLWSRFVPHFCNVGNSTGRITGVPDEGCWITLGSSKLAAVPAHFLHAEGNFHFYDPTSRILFSGDMGASMVEHEAVTAPIASLAEFNQHIASMEGFHRRYMVANKVCRLWANMVRPLVERGEVTMLVPQHGRYFVGKSVLLVLLDWISNLSCGIDRFDEGHYRIPGQTASRGKVGSMDQPQAVV
ncbi:MBL fold metallo-hydrolase [Chitinimonas sp. BJB300]|uniref:MBL fold metallo-hydrolase n=1 Tax=Chitinimonas sp. BJB300 TaxID=1559339 RepID=UPI000C0D568B|nr:MBL fold metallo-hydrolase [Chitinimonas sp. BJB300]PHV10755.1 MBL fold metallo-hydrolase [Chitinimonas sp. BJB300]TSJ89977.1 FprA family A-type flavoprotein [Chitinimonas sp. BJB300]